MESLNLKRILVPIDFAEASMNALHTATALARKHAAHLKLLFVHHNYDKYYPQINLNNGNDIIKTLTTLTKFAKDDHNVDCSFSYVMGDVCNCIIELSNSEHFDLVVVGKNIHPDNKKNATGSITLGLLEHCSCPVLFVPAHKTWTNFSHVLFPMRPTLGMIEKYVAVKEILKKDNSWLHILNLRNPSYLEELHIITRLVQLLKMKVKEENIQTSFSYYFRDDRFADKILAFAHDSKYEIDMIVITAETDNRESKFVVSPYAKKIISHTHVPVLIIKPDVPDQSKEELLLELEKQLN